MTRFEIDEIEPMTMSRTNRLANMYVLSPFVWYAGGAYHLLIRAVPRRDDEPRLKMAEIWYGRSSDGRHFEMDEAPVIFPGPDVADLDGCEDPTVHVEKGIIRVWYTGYNEQQRTGRLMLARGPDVARLAKAGVMIDSRPPAFANPKEATLVAAGKGGWRLLFEYARDGASLIGQADSSDLDGPWSEAEDSPIAPRPGMWDDWHLSPGPVIDEGTDRPTMFYNGATQRAEWRIGWATFDKGFTKVIERCDEPLIEPTKPLTLGVTDIAFAASLVERRGRVELYYSQSDQDLRRAIIRRA